MLTDICKALDFRYYSKITYLYIAAYEVTVTSWTIRQPVKKVFLQRIFSVKISH